MGKRGNKSTLNMCMYFGPLLGCPLGFIGEFRKEVSLGGLLSSILLYLY